MTKKATIGVDDMQKLFCQHLEDKFLGVKRKAAQHYNVSDETIYKIANGLMRPPANIVEALGYEHPPKLYYHRKQKSRQPVQSDR